MYRTSTILTIAWLALVAYGCGGAAPEAKEAEAPAHAPQAYPQPGAAPPPGGIPGGDHPPPPPPLVPQFKLTPERDLSTADSALQALEEDEVLLTNFLQLQAAELAVGRNACDRVCAALGSMQRSVDAICSLAGADDERCGRSRDRLEQAQQRVADAGCSCS